MALDHQPRLSALGVLRERDFRLFLSGWVMSYLGSQMTPVAVTFAVLGNGGSATDVGYVLMGESVPLVAFLLVGGVLADKLPRRAVMITADLLRLASQGALAVLLLTGRPALWELVAAEAVVGLGWAFFAPAMTGLIPEVASAPRLQQANALNGLAQSAGTIVGPALAGVIVAVSNPGWAIAADAATYLISAACLARVSVPLTRLAARSSFFSDLRSGWVEFRSRTWLWVIVVDFSFFHLIVFAPLIVLGAVVAKAHLGGAAAWGTILAAFGAGSVLGGLVMLRLRPSRPLRWAMLGMLPLAIPLALLALGAPTAAVSAGTFVAGVGLAGFGTLWDTTMQRQVPAASLSRVSSYDWFGSVALLPVGYAVVGPLAVLLGVSGALWLAAAWLVASSLVVLAVPSVRGLRAVDPGPGERGLPSGDRVGTQER
ncbi:MAG: MFS transporter [Acidimicrobiales bacterium]